MREPSDKPAGGQKGHKGETLRQVAEPDRIVDHYPSACTACGAVDSSLELGSLIVFDDLHWGEPVFLDLVEHVADFSRNAPILLLCMARPELIDRRTAWGGGKLNATVVLVILSSVIGLVLAQRAAARLKGDEPAAATLGEAT